MAKVFQILVPDNTLVSRIISCENLVTELFVIDRADKKFVSEYSTDLNKPALYILINRDKKQLYVGETDDSIKRLRNHEAKDFWTEAIVFHSTTDTLSTTEVKWCVWDAWAYVSDLVRSAKQRIVLIDNFVDDRVLSLLDKRANDVEAVVHSRYNELFLTDLKKHNMQYREIKFVQLPHKNHDRFLIIDNEVYLLGASLKDMGVGLCAITRMQIIPDTIFELLR